MDFVDVFCGVGGFSAGAMLTATPIMGVDQNDYMVRLWSANTKGKGLASTLWEENVEWPLPRPNLHVHLSPPCTNLSIAQRERGKVKDGIEDLFESIQFVKRMMYTAWSIETVSTPDVRKFVRDFQTSNTEFDMSWVIVDASEFGTPSSRVRMIIGNSSMIKNLKQTPVRRVSVEEAFQKEGMQVPFKFVKNNTRTKKGDSCVRPVTGPSHTQTASHPLTWCKENGETERCLTVEETRILMGFPAHWVIPKESRIGIRAIGNAVPPPLAYAIMSASVSVLI